MSVNPHREDTLEKATDLRLLVRLWRYVHPYRLTFFLSLLILPLASAFSLSQPYIMKVAIDNYIAVGDYYGLGLMGILFALALIGEVTVSYLQIYLNARVAQNSLADLREDLFSHIQRLPMRYLDRRPTGRLVTRVTTDTEAMEEMISTGAMTMITDSLTITGIVLILLMLHFKLALVSLALIPLLVLALNFFRIKGRETYRVVRERIARLNSYLQEAISGMTTIQLFAQEEETFEEFRAHNRAHREARHLVNIYESTLFSLVEAVNAISVALILWYGGGQILQGVIAFGTLVAFIDYLHKFFRPLRDFGAKYTEVQSALSSAERIFQLLDTPTEVSGKGTPHPTPKPKGDVEFRDVWFAYRENEPVLKGISLKVEAGEKVALVGKTGSGKTTLIKLLNRLYDFEMGSITVDGVDIRGCDLAELRKTIGVVSQDVFLFSGDIEKNIRLGKAGCDREELEAMARYANAHGFISSLPNGYRENLKERGSNISTGQKQLLALARALVHRPKILVLDEATSHVDSESEWLIQDALQKLMAGRTCIIIAHRLSTIQSVDRIVVLHKGQIRETGTHEELMRERGIYYRLYRIQAQMAGFAL